MVDPDDTPQPVLQSPPPQDPVSDETPLPPATAEPPLASVDSSVATSLEKEPIVQAPTPSSEDQSPAVTVVEKDVPLSLAPPPPPTAEEKVTVNLTDKNIPTSRPLSAALAEPQESESSSSPPTSSHQAELPTIEPEKAKPSEVKRAPESFASFKEESNKVSDLSDFERKALEEIKLLVQNSLDSHTLTVTAPAGAPEPKAQSPEQKAEISSTPEVKEEEEASIWGVPLMKDDRTDVILLKFLRARDFDVKKAFVMLKNTLIWRKQYNVDALIEEDLGDDLEKVVFMHCHDKEGHPVCFNVYGEFQNKELYNKTFADEEKRKRFLRWRIQFLERSIRKLDFRPGGICTIFQVSDLKNSPGPGKRELRIATKQALQLLQDNYPEFVAKQVISFVLLFCLNSL